MSSESSSSAAGGGGQTLEEIVDLYLEELAEGGTPDKERYLRDHPHLAEALRGVFRTLDFIETTGRTLGGGRLEQGCRLGEYEIVRELARGGMGVVYEALQSSLGRRVALKVLHPGMVLSDNARERFAREATTAARLHHTHIVPVYAVGEEEGVHYYAMQYIDGPSLKGCLEGMRAEGSHPTAVHFRRAAGWGRQVAEALAYAHGEGTIHRDVKPSNLLLDGRDHVWVTDFGLARRSAEITITASGDVVGTARYMSPEQASGGHAQLDARTDVYSLGATLHELVCLQPAVPGDSREEVLGRIAQRTPPPLRRVSRDVPRDLETIVSRCLEKERARRYPSARELAEDLRRFLDREPIRARRVSPLAKAWRLLRRHRLRVGAAVLLVALATLAAVLAVSSRRGLGARLVERAFVEILLERNHVEGARLLDRAEGYGIDSPDLHLNRALLCLVNRKGEAALPHLRACLQRDPACAEARLARALALSLGGDYNAGWKAFEEISELEIDSALGWLLHGEILSQTQSSSALESFRRATDLRPDFVPAIAARAHYRGYRLLTEGQRENLQPMLDEGRALTVFRPNSARSWAVRGAGWLSAAAHAAHQEDLASEREGWLERCREDLERAVALSGELDPLAHATQGTYLRYVGDYAAAEEAFARARAADARSPWGGDPALPYKHAAVLWAQGKLERALTEVEEAARHAPSYYPLEMLRTLLLAELGGVEDARTACAVMLERQSSHANALFIGAALARLCGFPDLANQALEEFSRADSTAITSEDADDTFRVLAFEYLMGREGSQTLIDAGRDRPGLRTELMFLVGLHRLGHGDREGGLAALRVCVDTGIFRFLEHRLAQTMLARAAADPEWPRWVERGR